MSPSATTASWPGLALSADLNLSQGSHKLRLTGQGQTLFLDATDSKGFVELLNSWPGRWTISSLRKLSHTLNACGFRIEVRFQGKPKMVIGKGADSRPFRLLGLPHLECSPRFLWTVLRHAIT